jgi:hypothetical protein
MNEALAPPDDRPVPFDTADAPGTSDPGVAQDPARADQGSTETKAEWLTALTAIVVSAALLAWGRGHAASVGAHFPISITVIPADAVNLDCSSDTHFGEVRCNFDARERSQPVAHPLRPYVSTGRELWLLSGVFEQPTVHDWLTQARRTGSNARVTIDCQAHLLGQLRTVPVRWQLGAAFASESNVPAARVSDCRVTH